MDSVDLLEADQIALNELKGKVLAFPEQVTRECNIPISKVAFLKGEFIHTNEFRIDEEEEEGEDPLKKAAREGGTQYISHTQTAQILQDRISAIEAKLVKMGKKHVKKNTSKGTTKGKKEDKHVSFDKNGGNGAAADDDNDMQSNGTTKGTAPPANFFEIREFVDESGQEVRHEVVNLSDEMNDLKGVVDKLKGEGGMDDDAGVGDTDVNSDKDTGEAGKKKALLDVLEVNLKNFDMDGQSSSTPSDPELAFALEAMQIESQKAQSADSSPDLSDDFWDNLQGQEQRWNDMLNAKEGASWSKGFLNKKPKQSKETQKKVSGDGSKRTVASTSSSKSTTPNTKKPSGSVRGTSMAFGDSILEKNI